MPTAAANKPPPAPPLTDEQISAIFMKKIDENRDGKLSLEELQKAFKELGSKFPAWRARFALWHADANGDGYISPAEMKEFVAYVQKQNYPSRH